MNDSSPISSPNVLVTNFLRLEPKAQRACGRNRSLAVGCALLLSATSAWTWELPVCLGNNRDGWAAVENNWQWDLGNPHTVDGGAEWTLAVQKMADPSGTDEYTPMENAALFNFLKGWADLSVGDATNPKFIYFGEGKDGRKLCAAPIPEFKFPQKSPASAILFKAPSDGKYQIAIEGNVAVQSKTAGYAKVSVSVLNDGRKEEIPLASFDLNSPGGYGEHPHRLSFSETVSLKAGSEIVTRLQTISPGSATAGSSTLAFDKYSIVPLEGN